MGLFDPPRIPAQAGDWLMVEQYNDAAPESVWLVFLPIIAWRKEGDCYLAEFLHERTAREIYTQKIPGRPWEKLIIRGSVLFTWDGSPCGELGDVLQGLSSQYRIRIAHVPVELRGVVHSAIERGIKLKLDEESEDSEDNE